MKHALLFAFALAVPFSFLALVGSVPCAWATPTETVVYNFLGGADGGMPTAGLISDIQGNNLYGTTSIGGTETCACGTVFKLSRNSGGSWTHTVLYSFTGGADGSTPSGSLVFDGKGSLYGTAWAGGNSTTCIGCGTVFKLTPSSGLWTEKTILTFNGKNGASPDANLVFKSGALYGTASAGGAFGGGIVFKLTNSSSGWKETLLHNFSAYSGDGRRPLAGLVFDSHGALYGTTNLGGKYGAGTVFMLSPEGAGWKETILYSFTGASDGAAPYSSLILDSSGALYGTTAGGGSNGGAGAGVVFKLTPSSGGTWSQSVLFAFGADSAGAYPSSGVIADSSGNLYGTTFGGNLAGESAVYKLIPRSTGFWKEVVLWKFSGGSDGGNAEALLLRLSGRFYGTTLAGGITGDICNATYGGGCGVVFEIVP